MTHAFFIAGEPAPQGSKSIVDGKGRLAGQKILVEGKGTTGRRRHRVWRKAVAETAAVYRANHMTAARALTGPVWVALDFRIARPRSRRRTEVYVAVTPDLDKLIRATCDGLVAGGVLVDDNRVAQLSAPDGSAHTRKVYAEPGTQPVGCFVRFGPLRMEDAVAGSGVPEGRGGSSVG